MLKETLLLNLNKPKIVDLIHRFNGFNPTVDVSSPLNFEAKLATKQLEIVIPHRELTVERIELIKDLISADFESVASDLKTFDLAKGHANRLISYLTSQGAENEQDLLVGGAQEFYNVSRNVLDPSGPFMSTKPYLLVKAESLTYLPLWMPLPCIGLPEDLLPPKTVLSN